MPLDTNPLVESTFWPSRHRPVQHKKGKRARHANACAPTGYGLGNFSWPCCKFMPAMWKCLYLRCVRLPPVSYCRRGRWLHMNHRGKSPSRFAPMVSVGLFTAAILGCSGMDRTGQICLMVRLCWPIRVSHGL
jgi:hypothetical protein